MLSIFCSSLLAALLKLECMLGGQKPSSRRHWKKRGFNSVASSLFARRLHALSGGPSFVPRLEDTSWSCWMRVQVSVT